MERSYPVSGEGHALKLLAIVCDLRGEPGVTPRARDFYRKCRLTHRNRFYLVQGDGGYRRARAVLRTPQTAQKGKHHVARDVPNIFAGSDLLKDEVAASLMRDAAGARRLNLPRYAPQEVFEEACAERHTDEGWRKKPGVTRNEAFDLFAYNLALAVVLEAEAINWASPPVWALPGPGNLMAVTAQHISGAEPPQCRATASEGNRSKWVVKKSKKKWR
jgi:phage terminase large subunit GpA-like protein